MSTPARSTGPTAAIAGIAPGIQAQGLWTGRRQLFVRFAAEAETATLYSPDMVVRHLDRGLTRPNLHSVCLGGRDPLSCIDFLEAGLASWKSPRPVMLDCDGQRPEALSRLSQLLSLVQVTMDFGEPPAKSEKALESLAVAAGMGCEHAIVLAPREGTSDGQLMRFVEQAHAASAGTKIVVHPVQTAEHAPLDRRYAALIEEAMLIHRDVRLVMRIPPPVGMR
ncbi:MAG: hypothetical protein ACR2OG_01185 [Gemmatimonadaceae bacterium]